MRVKTFNYLLVFLSAIALFSTFMPAAKPMGGGGCFLGDTAILLPDGSVQKISDLKIGEYVAGFDDQGNLMKNVVMNVFKFEVDNYFLLKTSNSEVKVTAEHPFYVGNGEYKTVVKLNVGDYVYLLNGNSITKEKILFKQRIDQPVNVYNLRVSNTNNYFANSFAVHNKGGGLPPGDGGETTVRTTISTTSSTTTSTTPTTSTTTTVPTCTIDCNTLDNWYDTGPFACSSDCQRCKPQEYRDYSCVGVECVPAVTNTRQFCEYAPTGNHCVSGSFTSSSYCGSSSAYCSGDCGYKIDRYECSGSHVCNYVDYSDTYNCAANTVCSAGSCVNDQACNTGGYQCKDQCSKAKPQYRCDGSGSCSSFWKWIDSSSCNPYSCSGGSCNGCEKDCGAECETSGDCPNKCVGDTRYYSGSCTSGCSCSYNTEECTGDGWYDKTGWSCQSDCQRCKQQEYRNYYCTPAGCTFTVTDTKQVCENSPAGQHCSAGAFTSSGYCGSSAARCSGNCGIAVDKYECSVSGVCNQLDYTETTSCPSDTSCSSGQCRSDVECGYSNLLCKDECNVAQKRLRCNAFGSCTQLWQWIDIANCNPFSCSSGSCTSNCDKNCGADCETNYDCQNFCTGDVRHYSGQCSSGCQCSYTTQDCNTLDGWYDYGSWYYKNNNCERCMQQKYRDYSCSPSGCTFIITDTRERCENMNEGAVCYTGGYACIDECSKGRAQSVCQAGECVFGSWINVASCNPKGCVGGICSGCNLLCGAGCENSFGCVNHCEGNVRYYDGSCSLTYCSCSFKNEDCSAKNGWYDTGNSRWSTCQDDACKLCQQKEKEHRTYTCSPSGCSYTVDGEEWFNTGYRKVIVCPTGTYCSNGECVKKECKGNIDITVSNLQFCPTVYYRFTANGVAMCYNKIVTFREGSCDGMILGRCTLGTSQTCNVNIKFSDVGTPTVFACLDKNGDGDYNDAGEQDSITVNVNCNNCLFTSCPGVCHRCYKCSGPCKTFVNAYSENICLNPDQLCGYSCVVGLCGAAKCNGDPSVCG